MGAEAGRRVDIALAVATRDGRVLVARRDPEAHLGGLWEFPGGRVAADETPAGAALRELREETGLDGRTAEPLVVVVHDYRERAVRLHAFLVREPEGDVATDRGREWAWVERSRLETLDMPEANGPILHALRWRLP